MFHLNDETTLNTRYLFKKGTVFSMNHEHDVKLLIELYDENDKIPYASVMHIIKAPQSRDLPDVCLDISSLRSYGSTVTLNIPLLPFIYDFKMTKLQLVIDLAISDLFVYREIFIKDIEAQTAVMLDFYDVNESRRFTAASRKLQMIRPFPQNCVDITKGLYSLSERMYISVESLTLNADILDLYHKQQVLVRLSVRNQTKQKSVFLGNIFNGEGKYQYFRCFENDIITIHLICFHIWLI